MCGVIGFYGQVSEKSISYVEESLKSLHHRGPDFQNSYVSQKKDCILGHTRLSIIDLSIESNQPMTDETSALSYNGEIYNYRTIRSQLKQDGVAFNTNGDTEVLFNLLKTKGIDSLSQITGMYAGAYYSGNSVTIFRDPIGIKPLYYKVSKSGSVIFSSEIKSFKNFEDLYPSENTIFSYLTFENFDQNLSLFKDIRMLPPGQWIEFSQNNGQIQQRNGEISLPKSDIEPDIYNTMSLSINDHIVSDVPVATYLSGGIDSSLVTALASEKNPDLHSFTGYFQSQDSHYDERDAVHAFKKKFPIKNHEVEINPNHFVSNFDDLIWALDEPRMGMGSFSQLIVSERIKQEGFKVVLAGHGGDELFGGYILFKICYLLDKGLLNPSTIRELKRFSKKEFPWLGYYLIEKLKGKNIQFAPRIFNRFENSIPRDLRKPFLSDSETPLTESLFNYYMKTYLTGLLVVEDKISMRNSVETRVPILSYQMLSLARQISNDEKIRDGILKSYLKRGLQGYLPKEVIYGPKRGFPTPLRLWFKNELRGFIQERLLQSNSFLDSFVPKNERERLIENHKNRPLPYGLDERRAHKIWMLLNLESWSRQFKIV